MCFTCTNCTQKRWFLEDVYSFFVINNIIVKIWGRIFFRNGGNGENQSTKNLIQMPVGLTTKARAKRLQEAFNGLVK